MSPSPLPTAKRGRRGHTFNTCLQQVHSKTTPLALRRCQMTSMTKCLLIWRHKTSRLTSLRFHVFSRHTKFPKQIFWSAQPFQEIEWSREEAASVIQFVGSERVNTGLQQVDSKTPPLALHRCPLYQQAIEEEEEEDIHLTHSLPTWRHMMSLTKWFPSTYRTS